MCVASPNRVERPSSLDATAKEIKAAARVAGVRYCAMHPDDAVFSVVLTIHVALTNVTPRRIIVAREMAHGGVLRLQVAKDENEAANGRFETTIVNDLEIVTLPDGKQPEFGRVPDPQRFATLESGDVLEATIRATVQGRRQGSNGPSTALEAGTKHVMRVRFNMWPFRFMKVSDVRNVRNQWMEVGRLIVGIAEAGDFALELPAALEPEVCTHGI